MIAAVVFFVIVIFMGLSVCQYWRINDIFYEFQHTPVVQTILLIQFLILIRVASHIIPNSFLIFVSQIHNCLPKFHKFCTL